MRPARDDALAGSRPRGKLRIDAHGYWARSFLVPHLPAFLDRYPDLELFLREGDRFADLLPDGLDCVIRHGIREESGMIIGRLCTLPELTCASPDYLTRTGTPENLNHPSGHQCVGFVSSRTGDVLPLECFENGAPRPVTMPSRMTVNGSETVMELGCMGYGLVQDPQLRFEANIAAGTLVEVLADFKPKPTLFCVLYAQNRHAPLWLRLYSLVGRLARPCTSNYRCN